MQKPDNLLVRLHRLAHRQDENFTTEAFSHLLRNLIVRAPQAADRVLERLTGLKKPGWGDAAIDTQARIPSGIPDIRIASSSALVYVEVKVEAGLSDGQAEAYLRDLEELPDAPEAARVVVLTRYPAPTSLPERIHQVRWFEIAEVLDTIKSEELPQVTRHLVEQFLAFLGQRGMAVLQVRSGISSGIQRYENRLGDQSIFASSRVRSLSRIGDDDDLRPLYDLLFAMGVAIEQSGLFDGGSWLDSGKHDGGWIGYSIHQMQYFFFLRLNAPELVLFQAYDAPVDPEKHDGSTGRVEQQYGDWRWEQELDLASDDLTFFSRSKAEQQTALINFVLDSYRVARSLE